MKFNKGKKLRYWLALIFCLCMVLPLMGNTADAADPKDGSGNTIYIDGGGSSYTGKDWYAGTKDKPVATLQKALQLAGEGGTIRVMSPIYLKDADDLSLENVTIIRDESWSDLDNRVPGLSGTHMIVLQQGTALTLGEGALIDGNGEYGTALSTLMTVESGATLNIKDGAAIQNNKAGGVLINGTVNMDGGEIKECSDGGVFLNNGSVFNLSGGKIIDNSSEYNGGGVTVSGTFNMTGGTIEGNTTGQGGGGIFFYCGSKSTLTGGTITGNSALYGGGICILGNEVTLDGTEISSNSTSGNGGGVYVEGMENCSGILTMKSGSIINNKTTGSKTVGGGIMAYYSNYSGQETLVNIEGGVISGNTCTGSGDAIRIGGNYDVKAFAHVNLSGSPTISGLVHIDTNNTLTTQLYVTGSFAPTAPVNVYDYAHENYRPVITYADGLTPDLSQFTTANADYELYLEGQDISLVKPYTVTVKEKDGSAEYVSFKNLPDKVLDQTNLSKVERAGYTLTGYMTDSGDTWDMEKDLVDNDLILYPVWKLDPPTFTLTADKDKVHVTPVAGGEATLTAAVSPHAASNITYTWQWYKGDTLIEEGKNTETIKVNEPGTYRVVIVADHGASVVSDPAEDTIVIGTEDHIYPDEWKSNETSHWKECTVCKNEDSKDAHIFGEWVVIKKATAKETGLKERACSKCGYKMTEKIPATGGGTGSGSTPGTSGTSDTSASNAVRTGVVDHTVLWAVLLGISGFGAISAAVIARKKRNQG